MNKICRAVIACLDEFGYAETTINSVQQKAGVSRGAMTYHFPTKEDMITEVVERLLDPVRGQSRRKSDQRSGSTGRGIDLREDLNRLWSRVVNTTEGRALFEVLVAARTDAQLRARITPGLVAYNDDINRSVSALYAAPTGEADDVVTLWTMCRAFLRGLHVQERFENDPAMTARVVDRFAEIMATHLSPREHQE